MTKKVKISILSVISFTLLGAIIISSISLYPIYFNNKKEIEIKEEVHTNEGYKNRLKNYDIILCNFDLKNPEYIFIDETNWISDSSKQSYRYSYYILTRPRIFSQTWTIDKYTGYNGGGSIYPVDENDNSFTFDKLKEMVEKDCNQFKVDNSNSEHRVVWDFRDPTSIEQQLRDEREKAEKEKYYQSEEFFVKIIAEQKQILTDSIQLQKDLESGKVTEIEAQTTLEMTKNLIEQMKIDIDINQKKLDEMKK